MLPFHFRWVAEVYAAFLQATEITVASNFGRAFDS